MVIAKFHFRGYIIQTFASRSSSSHAPIHATELGQSGSRLTLSLLSYSRSWSWSFSFLRRSHLPRWNRRSSAWNTRLEWAGAAACDGCGSLSCPSVADRCWLWAVCWRWSGVHWCLNSRCWSGCLWNLWGARGTTVRRLWNGWTGGRWVHALSHELLQAFELSIQLLEARIGGLFLSINGLWNQVLQSAHLVGDAARLVLASAAGRLELCNNRFDFCQCAVKALGSLLFSGLQLLGIFGELVKERESLLE